MSSLDAFLNPVYTEKTIEVVVSDRFIDPETKEPAKFVLRTMSQDEKSAIRKRSMVIDEINGNKFKQLDNDLFLGRCIVEACVSPDLKAAELGKKYGAVAPDTVLKKMLNAKEYDRLAKAFMELNILDDDSPDMGELTKK